jgi:hypothetical protein
MSELYNYMWNTTSSSKSPLALNRANTVFTYGKDRTSGFSEMALQSDRDVWSHDGHLHAVLLHFYMARCLVISEVFSIRRIETSMGCVGFSREHDDEDKRQRYQGIYAVVCQGERLRSYKWWGSGDRRRLRRRV